MLSSSPCLGVARATAGFASIGFGAMALAAGVAGFAGVFGEETTVEKMSSLSPVLGDATALV